jgi:hypothetical protein
VPTRASRAGTGSTSASAKTEFWRRTRAYNRTICSIANEANPQRTPNPDGFVLTFYPAQAMLI